MLFSNKKNENEKPKQQSLMGFLFKPDIGGSIRPIGESIGMFVRLIAMIFAAHNLFPKNHPALTGVLEPGDPRARLTMGMVIGTAWRNLSFSRESVPKVLIFFAVIGCLGFGALIAFSFVMSLFTSQAHAASMFTPASEDDLAFNWLEYLFNGKDISFTITDTLEKEITVFQSHTIQNALMSALSYYSTAVLVVAGIVLLYHLTSMVAETAHTGKVMGNANQIWAPIRLVFAVGLLVPISGGLNTGQYIAVKMAEWGSALASNTWALMLNEIASDPGNLIIMPPAPPVTKVVKDLANAYACRAIYNYYLDQMKDVIGATQYTNQRIEIRTTTQAGNVKITTFGNNMGGQQDICGSYSYYFPMDSENALDAAINSKKLEVVKDNRTALEAAGTALETKINEILPVLVDVNSETELVSSSPTLKEVVKNYKTALKTTIKNNFPTAYDASMSTLANKWSGLGWVTAGAWFNTIARSQERSFNASADMMPMFSSPRLGAPSPYLDVHVEDAASKVLEKFINWIETGIEKTASYTTDELDDMGTDAAAGTLQASPDSEILSNVLTIFKAHSGDFKLWEPRATIVGTTPNPLAELAFFGNRNIVTAFKAIDFALPEAFKSALWGAALQAKARMDAGKSRWSSQTRSVPEEFGGQILSARASIIMSLTVIFATLLFVTGITLSYILPLLPFTLFFFNTLSWLVSVFESIVSMPLLALAHLTTKGDGIHGDMARTGYFFLFAIFLRPVLMVFGLVAGLLIFTVAIGLLNMTFSVAASGLGAFRSGTTFGELSMIVFNVIYAMMAYICANTAFKTIGFFPEHAMRWMSQQGPSTEKMGDKQLMSAATTAMTAYAFKDTLANTIQAHTVASGAGLEYQKEKGKYESENPGKSYDTTDAAKGFFGKRAGEAYDAVKDISSGNTNLIPSGPEKNFDIGLGAPPGDPSRSGDGVNKPK